MIFADPRGTWEVIWDSDSMVAQIKLENEFDMLILLLYTDATIGADAAVTVFNIKMAVLSTAIPPVSAGFAFSTMESLTKLGIDFTVGTADICYAKAVMSEKGYVYYYFSPIPNPLTAGSSKVSARPRFSKPRNVVSTMTAAERNNHVYDTKIVSSSGRASLRMETK